MDEFRVQSQHQQKQRKIPKSKTRRTREHQRDQIAPQASKPQRTHRETNNCAVHSLPMKSDPEPQENQGCDNKGRVVPFVPRFSYQGESFPQKDLARSRSDSTHSRCPTEIFDSHSDFLVKIK